jgi:hypothetical protein
VQVRGYAGQHVCVFGGEMSFLHQEANHLVRRTGSWGSSVNTIAGIRRGY